MVEGETDKTGENSAAGHEAAPPGNLSWLSEQLDIWVRERIVTKDQAGLIARRYGLPYAAEEERVRRGRLIMLLSLIGAVSIGVGVILFFAANWRVIPRPAKLAIIFCSVFAAYRGGYYLCCEKKTYPKVGSALILLGAILYGSGIWLIAQMFHISAHYPTGVLVWALGILPLVVLLRSVPLLVFYTVLLTIWTLTESTSFENANYLYVPVLLGSVLPFAYWWKSRFSVTCALWGLCVWLCFAVLFSGEYKFDSSIWYLPHAYLSLGLLLYSSGTIHSCFPVTRDYKLAFQRKGVWAVLIFLFVLSFGDFLQEFRQSHGEAHRLTVVLICVAAVSVVIALSLGYRSREKIKTLVTAELLFVAGILGLTAAHSLGLGLGEGGSEADIGYAALFNLALFGGALGLILVGYYNRYRYYIYMGAVFIGLGILARYFDLFFDLLPKSVFFIGGGIILLVMSFAFERTRRQVAFLTEKPKNGA